MISAIPRENGRVNMTHLAELVVACLSDALGVAGAGNPAVICIGMSGLPDLVDNPEIFAQVVGGRLGAGSVILAADAVTTHVGALRLASGTVVSAGTGVVAMGSDLREIWTRSDGWGLLLGDEGGGAWIGQQGLIAALRSADGRRGGSARMLELMHEHLGQPDKVVNAVYGSDSPSYLLGRFAPYVAQAAVEGDEVARELWSRAGRSLASAAASASEGVEPVYSWGGRLFEVGALLLDPFAEALAEMRPGSTLVEPVGTSTDGAILLAQDHVASPRLSRPPHIQVFDVEQ